MKGRRVYPDSEGYEGFIPGDYGLDPRDGNWYCRPPGGKVHVGNLSNHKVTEHEDGTITVSPSILIHYPGHPDNVSWHGYLEKGIWREV